MCIRDSSYPDPSNLVKQEEPFVDVHLYTPNDYVGGLKMCIRDRVRYTELQNRYIEGTA